MRHYSPSIEPDCSFLATPQLHLSLSLTFLFFLLYFNFLSSLPHTRSFASPLLLLVLLKFSVLKFIQYFTFLRPSSRPVRSELPSHTPLPLIATPAHFLPMHFVIPRRVAPSVFSGQTPPPRPTPTLTHHHHRDCYYNKPCSALLLLDALFAALLRPLHALSTRGFTDKSRSAISLVLYWNKGLLLHFDFNGFLEFTSSVDLLVVFCVCV